MKDTIYLICTPKGVDRLVKTSRSAKDLRKNEIPVKMNLSIDDGNWRPPFVVKDVRVDRWDRGVDVSDPQFEGDFVTEEEAAMIRRSRLDKMRDILRNEGYEVSDPGEDEEQ